MTDRHAYSDPFGQHRRNYMRQWQAKRRWPTQVETALKRLETLLAARPDGQALPEMPAAVRAAWGLDLTADDTGPHLTEQQRAFLDEIEETNHAQK